MINAPDGIHSKASIHIYSPENEFYEGVGLIVSYYPFAELYNYDGSRNYNIRIN